MDARHLNVATPKIRWSVRSRLIGALFVVMLVAAFFIDIDAVLAHLGIVSGNAPTTLDYGSIITALAAGVTLYPKLSFDAVKDFAPIGLINTTASTLAGSASLPPNNLKELLSWAKEPGRTIKIGHAGVGSYGHLSGVLVAQELGMKASQIPYRGAGPALVDLLSGQIDLTSISAIQSAPFAASGKLKVYAIIGRRRFPGLPDIPTLGELGYKKLDIDFWHMLVAPAATPRPIIEKLNTALRATLADATVQKSFADGGMVPYPPEELTPEAAHTLLKNEIKLWHDVINANQIAAQSQ